MGKRAIFALAVWLVLGSVLRAADHPQLLTTVPLSKDASSETGVQLDPQALVLVELKVVKGDTLWKFAKRYLARPDYYAQFLVYNRIKNPSRIYPGQTLWVPLGPVKDHPELFSGQAVPRWIILRAGASAGRPVEPERPAPLEDETSRSEIEKPASEPAAVFQPRQEMTLSPAPFVRDPAQVEFEEGLDIFNRGDYPVSAGKFESFISNYPDSSLRVKAEYYLAESYRLLEQEP